jgi:hypothetical protein
MFFSNKILFLSAVVLFEVGSALCGAAPNSTAFILGRAIAGTGASGVFAGIIAIMIPLVPLHKRPMYQGLLGAIFGVSSVVGPLVGGAFTKNESLTWRWCFYVNLPIGALSLFVITFFLKIPQPTKHSISLKEKFRCLDPLGNLFFVPSIFSLLLALQWGGSQYSWSNARIIALLVLFVVLLAAWITAQAYGGERATIPPRIFLQRSIISGFCFSCCVGGIMLAFSYYIAIWFQAIDGVDALQSGIRTLPFILALVIASIINGGLVTAFGYYKPSVIFSSIVMSIGTGLLTTLRVGSGPPEWIGYQFLAGFGMGVGMQQSGLAAQVVLAPEDVPIGASLMFFGQGLGGAIFVCVAQNVFLQELIKNLAMALSGQDDFIEMIIRGVGATELRGIVPPELLPAVLEAYNKTIVTTFYVGLGVACFSIVPALGFEWRSVKELKSKKGVSEGGRDVESASKEVVST